MYRITYIHKDSTAEHPLYIAGDQDYCLTDAQLDLEMGKAGELNIYIPEINPAREEIECLTDEIVFYRDGVEIWRGRPVTMQIDFDRTGRLTCEGILSYLYDTYFEPFEFEGSPNDLFRLIIENHNSRVEERRQFKIGEITVEDPNDYINRSSIYYNRSLEVLTEKLINDSLGGYFRVRVEPDGRYIDYLESYGTQASQVVEYGSNILDIAEEVEYSSLATAILPLGARLTDEDGMETDEYTTIASVNGGSIYYQDDDAVATYGWICVSMEWENVTEPSNLLSKAADALRQYTNAVSSFEVNAVDLSLISEAEPINIGDYVYIRALEHNINQYVELTKMTIHPLAPENDVLQFGADSASITGTQRNSDRAVQSALGSLSMRVTNLTADVINAVYANIGTIVADTVTTEYIEARIADLGYATIQYLKANYIDANAIAANYISVSSEWVTNLDAFTANITNLLSGSIGTGELQTIHLTADNVVIDDAVIFDLIAGNATIGNLLAGIIYTDFIKIANNDGENLLIDGSTIQIFDGSYVRIQIGEDASGDYNMYIWDGNGNLLWDALGLTEAGLAGNGAIVKDMNIADDAAIQGYKIDMESLSYCLNEYGGLTMEAGQITIDGNTLEYKLTTMTTEINQIAKAVEGIEMDGVVDIRIYYALGESDTEAPENGDDAKSAICGEFLCGELLCGATGTGSVWGLEEPTAGEGEYVWFRHRVEYVDGTVVWTTPTCITSGYMMTHLYSLQTELEVVQGQISATVTRSDVYQIVNESLEEGIDVNTLYPRNYCLLSGGYTKNESVDAIVTSSSDSTYGVPYDGYLRIEISAYQSLYQRVYWSLSSQFETGVEYTVTVKWRSNMSSVHWCIFWTNISTGVGWYYDDMGTYDVGTDWTTTSFQYTPALYSGYSVDGIGFSVLNDGGAKNIEVESIMVEKGDTAHDWTRAPEDYATTSQITVLQDRYAGIIINIDGIQEAVATVTTAVSDNWEYFETKYSELVLTDEGIKAEVADVYEYIDGMEDSISTHFSRVEQTADEIKQTVAGVETKVTALETDVGSLESSVKAELESLGVDISGISSNIKTIQTQVTTNTSKIDQLENEIVSEVRQVTTNLTEYIDKETGEVLAALGQTETEIYSRIDQLAGSITLSVTNGSLGNTAQIRLSVNGSTTSQSLDLAKVRQAFASDTTAITISAGTITLASGILLISSGQLILDAKGNATFSGNLSAPSGNIGGWTIGTNSLYNGCSSMTSTSNGTYIGASTGSSGGIRQYYGGDYVNITTGQIVNGNSDGDVAALYSGSLKFTHSGTLLGFHGTNSYVLEPTKYGMTIDAEYDCKYIGFAHMTSSSATTYTWDYLINYGLSTGSSYVGYTQKHILYGDVRITDSLYTDSIYFRSSSSGSDTFYINTLSVDSVYRGLSTNGYFDVASRLICGGTVVYSYALSVNGSAYATGSFYSGSDVALKTDVKDIDADADTMLDALEPVTYRYKDDDERMHFGVTYQNVVEALEAAGLDPDDTAIVNIAKNEETGEETGAVAYSELIGLLIYEVKQLKQQIKRMGG